MRRNYLLVPTSMGVNVPEVTEGFFQTIQKMGTKVSYFRPFSEKEEPNSISIAHAERLLSTGNGSVLMEQVLDLYQNRTEDKDIVVVEGLSPDKLLFRSKKLNKLLARALDVFVVLVSTPNGRTPKEVLDEVEIEAQDYLEINAGVAGCILNALTNLEITDLKSMFGKGSVPVIAYLPKDGTPLLKSINRTLIRKIGSDKKEHSISQAEFRSSLIRMAKKNQQRIILPEGSEPRTIQAALLAFERRIAIPVLIGNKKDIYNAAESQNLTIPKEIEIVEPTPEKQTLYAEELYELRKEKGLTLEKAKEFLQSNIWFGTMMLKHGEVDGLVSGAIHSTADTVRPALQVIKTAPGVKKISSVFFMCLPSQVFIYGDCAINENPTAEELASIAIQSNDTAKAFGLPARVAMLSYSTGKSGSGVDVDLVFNATEIVRKTRPDILIDGPLQYDTASTPSVARIKAPASPIAGKASVFIFPNLNAGNITYKAVQRSAPNVICVGPMLQGLAKPVNDLSRGALIEDIVYTIALTAIQAQNLTK